MKQDRALVVGASGGIGAALSLELAATGVEVTSLSRSVEGFDITDPRKVEASLEGVRGPFNTILVASGMLAPAGEWPERSLSEIDVESMAQVLAVNAIGPALVLKHVPELLARNERSVVGVITARVGSIGDNRLGGWYSYRASKAAANQIFRTAAIEIARKRKHAIVVALHPGTVSTAFTARYQGYPKVKPSEAASNLLTVLDQLTPSDTGQFFDWAGKQVQW